MALLHAGVLWALYAGLQRPSGETAVAMMRVADVSLQRPAPQAPRTTPTPRQTDMRAAQAKDNAEPPAARTSVVPVAAPAPVDAPASGGTPSATGATAAPEAGAAASASASLGATRGAAQSRVEAPSSEAPHLRNPRPTYPIQSRRLGEQGKVVVRVLVGPDGAPQQAQVHQTSGHDRLDQTARATALTWRYVPGTRAGAPEAMWLDVPIQFVLE